MLEPVPLSELATALGLGSHELVGVTGGGGKTTVLFALGRQLAGTVVLTTTTKMGAGRTDGFPLRLRPSDVELAAALADHGSVLVWDTRDDHKATGVAPEVCDRWFDLAVRGDPGLPGYRSERVDREHLGHVGGPDHVSGLDHVDQVDRVDGSEHVDGRDHVDQVDRVDGPGHVDGRDHVDQVDRVVDHVVVEADGSRRLPCKAPGPFEPVLPSRTTTVIACVGASAFGRVIADRCHRPLRVAALAGCSPYERLTPSRLARVLTSGRGGRKGVPAGSRFVVLLNQVSAADRPFADELADEVTGALDNGLDDGLVGGPVDQLAEELVDGLVGGPVDQLAEELVDGLVDGGADGRVDGFADGAALGPVNRRANDRSAPTVVAVERSADGW